jgi:hypothetical protein
MGANNVVGVSSVGNKVIVENVGAKRILGTELLATGKMPDWVYYLVDIDQLCVYSNNNDDIWIGAFGHPIAGSLTIRDSLTPFQGQKFYVIETDISYTYMGGAWEGGVIEANTLAPTILILDAPTTLTRGRSHEVAADGGYTLPVAIGAEVGDSLEGHFIGIYVERGIAAAHLLAPGAEEFIDAAGATSTDLLLQSGVVYSCVFNDGQWEVFYIDVKDVQDQLDALVDTKMDKAANLGDVVDPTASRANIDVYSIAESAADSDEAVDNQNAGTGILKTGSSAASTTTFHTDFASSVEAIDNSIADKAISPKTMSESQQVIQRYSELIQRTGLVQLDTETQFALDRHPVNLDTLIWDEFTVVFNPEPSTQLAALQIETIPAGSMVVPNVAGITAQFVTINTSLVIAFSLTRPPVESVDLTLLGLIALSDGDIVDLAPGVPFIENIPWLGSSAWGLRHATPILTGGAVTPNPDIVTATIDIGGIERSEESINFAFDTSDAHLRTFPAVPKATWSYTDSTGVVIGPGGREDIDGSLLEGGVVGANNYGVQVVFVTRLGTFIILVAQVEYTSLLEAQAAISGYAPTIPTVLANSLELSRMAVRGNQLLGNGQLDLEDATKFFTIQGTGVAGAGANNAANIVSNTNNGLADTNVQGNLDELAARSDITPTTGGGAVILPSIMVDDVNPYTLPVVPVDDGIVQKLVAEGSIIATFNTNGGGNDITSSNNLFADDNVFRIMPADNGKIYYLISKAGKWVL